MADTATILHELRAALPEGAVAALARFKAGFDASDPAAILACFAPGAVFLGTTMPAPTTDPAGIEAYFAASGASGRPRRIELESAAALLLSDGAVLLSGQQRFYRTAEGQEASTPARYTLVLTQDGQGWRIAHFHSSRRPMD